LVVTLYEIISIEGGTVYPGEGSAHFHVVFRVVARGAVQVANPVVTHSLQATWFASTLEPIK
jgi:hypothetical protein